MKTCLLKKILTFKWPGNAYEACWDTKAYEAGEADLVILKSDGTPPGAAEADDPGLWQAAMDAVDDRAEVVDDVTVLADGREMRLVLTDLYYAYQTDPRDPDFLKLVYAAGMPLDRVLADIARIEGVSISGIPA